MWLTIRKTQALNGQLSPPSSKSHTIRALFIGLMTKGHSTLTHTLLADDTYDAMAVCQALGAKLKIDADRIEIASAGLPLATQAEAVYVGNSGLTAKFILPLLGYRNQPTLPIRVDSGAQMRTRPIASLVEALRALGLTITYVGQEGFLPIEISGTLQGGQATVAGNTSQYLSALLLALPCAPRDSIIRVQHLCERPYVDMTLSWLVQQGIDYRHRRSEAEDVFEIKGQQRYRPFQATLPGDFSSASYLIAAAVLLSGEVVLHGLSMEDCQGDKRLVAILQAMGADIRIEADRLSIRGGKPLTAMTIDARDIPDLVPTLAVVATQAQGITTITQVAQARIKETDRLASMTDGLTRMHAKVIAHLDGLTIYPSALQGAVVKGYGDHRTVMALAVAGLVADGTTTVDDAAAIHKTFPEFVEQMRTLGAKIEVVHA